jgi:hypothetical protein
MDASCHPAWMTDNPHTLASVMPASKPSRPRWGRPVIVVLAALLVVAGGVGAYTLVGRSATSAPAAAPSATVKPAPTVGRALDATAVEVCAALLQTDLTDVTAAAALGEKAALSADSKIRLDGIVLRDVAKLAALHPNPGGQISYEVDVKIFGAKLRATCIELHYQ